MTVEISSCLLQDAVVLIEAIDVSDENLQRMERLRDDGFEREITFAFDTRVESEQHYLYRWLHRQKAVKQKSPRTWGEALHAVRGTVTTLSGKYIMERE